VQYMETCLHSFRARYKHHIPGVVTDPFWIPEQGNQTVCAPISEWDRVLKYIKKATSTKIGYQKIRNHFFRTGKAYTATSLNIGRRNLRRLSNKQICELYKQYFQAQVNYVADLWILFDANDIWSNIGKEILEKKGLTPQAADFASLFSPAKKVGMLKLKSILENRYKKVLSELFQEYKWMSCLDLQNDPWTMKDLISMYKNIKPEKNGLSAAKAAKIAKLSTGEKEIFKKIKDLAYIKDLRDVFRRKGIYSILPLFEEIGERFGLDRKTVAYFTSGEIISGLFEGHLPAKKQICARRSGCAVCWKGDAVMASLDPKLIKNYEKNLPSFAASTSIQGQPANKGQIRGKIKIVMGIKDLPNVSTGLGEGCRETLLLAKKIVHLLQFLKAKWEILTQLYL